MAGFCCRPFRQFGGMILLLTIGAALLGAVLFWGKIPPVWFWAAEAGITVVGFLLSRCAHDHGGMLAMDVCAQKSRFLSWNAGGKLLFALGMLFFSIGANSVAVGLSIFFLMAILVLRGGVSVHEYLSCLTLPLGFLLLGSLTVAVQLGTAPAGNFSLPIGSFFLSVTEQSRGEAVRLLCKALGAVGCLLFLSLSTPMGELIAVFRKIKVPAVVIELMYLIYRYIFILLDAAFAMQQAAESRLGYRTIRIGLRSYGRIAANLLAVSFKRASENFDAMESRCYDGEIRFLTRIKPVTRVQLTCYAGCVVLAGCVWGLEVIFR